MRALLFRTLIASAALSIALIGASTDFAQAQTPPAQQVPTNGANEDADAASGQLALTEKQVEGLLAARKAISAIVEKIPEDQIDEPNPRIQAALDKTAKQFGFKDYGEYDDVANNVTFILEGFDPEKKTFVGHDVLVKQEIARIAADDSLQPRDKKAQLRELRETLKSIEPVEYPDNITLVTKYYDKLSEIFNEDD